MSPATFRLILLVSFAHGLVHVFELSLPSVEQMIGDEFGCGRRETGLLGTVWRLPFGLGALLAGWLADRFGSKPMLLVYLCGCSATALLAWWAPSLGALFGIMFLMGCFASIYHPAGLALISRETTPENRGAALGLHGIVGSLGIASAPFLAGLVFSTGAVGWRQYYLLLMIPAGLLAVLLSRGLTEHHVTNPAPQPGGTPGPTSDDDSNWRDYFLLVATGALSGVVYAAFMHFLPRYLDSAHLKPSGMTPQSFRNLLTALVLVCGVLGQGIAGRLARPGRLEGLLVLILFGNAPLLWWMASADGPARLAAACLLALVHFMNQPVYNSLIAQYVPRVRRSVGYGFSNMICFGIGALGPAFAGFAPTERDTYRGLAVVALTAAFVALPLKRRRRADEPTG